MMFWFYAGAIVLLQLLCQAKGPLVRLALNQTVDTQTRGTLQIYHNGEWGYICDTGFDENAAKVVCRELGLPTKYVAPGFSGSENGITHSRNMRCRGDETSLSDCSANDRGYCPSFGYNRVELTCDSVCPHLKYGDNCKEDCPCKKNNTESCDMETGECVCKPGYTGFSCNCQAGSHSCNTTVSDCYEESSEVFCICKKGFTNSEYNCTDNIRLNSNGIVQVFEGDRWDGICDDNLKKNARVICRHLNESTEFIYSTSKHQNFRYAEKSVNCTGTEEMLSECPFLKTDSSCSYSPVVYCGDCPDWKYSDDCSKTCDCVKETSTGCDFRDGTCSCRDGFKGEDCSCHVSTAPCSGSFSKCKFDRCICKEGSFNQSASCSDLSDVVVFCTFEKEFWKDTCNFSTSNPRLRRDNYGLLFGGRPKAGTDDLYYVFQDTKSFLSSVLSMTGLSIGPSSTDMVITLTEKRKQFCLYFDYFLYGRGSITISKIDNSYAETFLANLTGTQQNWTTKNLQLNEGKALHQIKIAMEESTAIDRIIVTGSSCVCSDWTFGQDCDKCACVRMHTESCDKTTGACRCKAGYTGDACQCEASGKPCLHNVRLVNGNTSNVGRVEVVTEGIWSTVCHDNWDNKDATVVCKQLGLGNYGIAKPNGMFGRGIGPIYVDNVACKGNETNFLDCPFIRSSCDHSDDAGVECVNALSIIRLRDGTDRTNGRLEIKLDEGGSWGTVCDDGFGETGARVACRQLGLPTRNVRAKTTPYRGLESRPILLNNLQCDGDEPAIQSCNRTKNPFGCTHDEDAGISCSDECPPFKFGKECEKSCACNRRNSLSCDKGTGECRCKNGWSDVRCTCGRQTKCDENSYCDGLNCLCNDGFFTQPSNCSDVTDVLYSCSFETTFDACFIKNYGKMKWRKGTDRTYSRETGPISAQEGKNYVYTEANLQFNGDKGVMEIPVSNLNLTTHACFQLFFHMRGEDMGDLNVAVQDINGLEVARWSKSGHQGSLWDKGLISFPSTADVDPTTGIRITDDRKAEINITGIRGDGHNSDLALDDFKIFQGHCDCGEWKYGLTCEKSCYCTRETSEGCNSQTGSCICQSGWSGKTCDCRKSPDPCNPEYSFCHGDMCLCKDGVYANGVTCSGIDNVIYFCTFATADSVHGCKIELSTAMWEKKEVKANNVAHNTNFLECTEFSTDFDSAQLINDSLHLNKSSYLQTRLSPKRTMYSFSLRNVTLKRDSCFQLKYYTLDPTMQSLRIQVIRNGHLMSNRLFQGRDWSTARVPIKASSLTKIVVIVYVNNNLPVLIDDIIITAKTCDACQQWYYGSDCEKMSKCNQRNTLSFDAKDNCICKTNWYGVKCDCSQSENDACIKRGEICMGGVCSCVDGYIKAGLGCRDIDECKSSCMGSLQTCENMNGSYSCLCEKGNFGDGDICSESTLAITNGSTPMDGTLLMWRDNIWGAVCQSFDLFTAMVACNTLFENIYGVHLPQRGGYDSPNGVTYSSFVCDKKGKGFDLTKCNVSIEPCDTAKDATQLSCGVCGGVYTSQVGLVEPPFQLLANTLCFFLLAPYNSKRVNATFISFSTNSNEQTQGYRDSSITCDDTYLEIFDGSDIHSPLVGRYCGSRPHFTVTSTGNTLYLIYKTSRNKYTQDFHVIYEAEKNVENLFVSKDRALDGIDSHIAQCVPNNISCINNKYTCLRDRYVCDRPWSLEQIHHPNRFPVCKISMDQINGLIDLFLITNLLRFKRVHIF